MRLYLIFWAGTIVPASQYFKKGAQFYGFDASVIQCCRVKEGESNPFKIPCLIETREIKEFKQSTSNKIISIINERKSSGEYIPEFNLNKILIDQSRHDGANVSDLEFNARTSEIKQNLLKLGLFEDSARKIQTKFRETILKNKTLNEPISPDLSELNKSSKKNKS